MRSAPAASAGSEISAAAARSTSGPASARASPTASPAIGHRGRTIVATGHGMKDVSLAPVTGRLVAQLVAGEQPDHDLTPFDPNRF
jgi:glycine/D-amino acid oxidase-like deaminating enzyme